MTDSLGITAPDSRKRSVKAAAALLAGQGGRENGWIFIDRRGFV